jgi:hypothetical protein
LGPRLAIDVVNQRVRENNLSYSNLDFFLVLDFHSGAMLNLVEDFTETCSCSWYDFFQEVNHISFGNDIE